MNFLNYLLNIRFAKPLLAMVLLLLMALSSLNIYIDTKLPDLAVVDLKMPKLTGEELLQKVRKKFKCIL